MKRYYRVEYSLFLGSYRQYFISNPIKALCKLHALIKFKMKYKHKKYFKREIYKIRRYRP